MNIIWSMLFYCFAFSSQLLKDKLWFILFAGWCNAPLARTITTISKAKNKWSPGCRVRQKGKIGCDWSRLCGCTSCTSECWWRGKLIALLSCYWNCYFLCCFMYEESLRDILSLVDEYIGDAIAFILVLLNPTVGN